MSGSENAIISMLESMTGTKWMIIGIVLMIIEVSTGTTLILWPAVSALIVGVLAFFLPVMGWEAQFILFFILTAFLLVFGHYYIRPKIKHEQPSDLNDRSQSMVGIRVKAVTDFETGEGRVQVGDTQWKARTASGNPPAGSELIVRAVRGTTLIVD